MVSGTDLGSQVVTFLHSSSGVDDLLLINVAWTKCVFNYAKRSQIHFLNVILHRYPRARRFFFLAC